MAQPDDGLTESEDWSPRQVFQHMSDERRDVVVSWVLDNWRKASGELQTRFSDRIDAAIRIHGFRQLTRTRKLPPQLRVRLRETVTHNDLTAAATLDVWIDTHRSLREALRDRDVDADVEALVESFHETHSDFTVDDVKLMIDCAPLWRPDRDVQDHSKPLEQSQDGVSPTVDLGWLGRLSPDAPEWDQFDTPFLEGLSDVLAQKVAERRQAAQREAAELRDEFTSLFREHTDTLEYFRWDTEAGVAGLPAAWADMAAAREAKNTLEELLIRYLGVRDVADNADEELERGKHRGAQIANIRESLRAFDELEVVPPPAVPGEDSPGDAVQDQSDSSGDADASDHAEVEQLRVKNRQLGNDTARLSGANSRLERDNSELAAKGKALEGDLAATQEEARTWKKQSLTSGKAPERSVIPRPEFKSVKDVVQAARSALEGQLSFHLNKKSDTEIQFDRPGEVAETLEWLADTYYRNKIKEVSVPDLATSLRETSGWEYSPFQSEVTMGKYRSDYETKVRGRRFELKEHVGTGSGRDKSTIRIAFTWNHTEQKVIVGYVGRHQRTDAS